MQRLSPAQRKIFDPDSPACHSALQQLAVVHDNLGFTVRKESPREATLRVYPRGSRRYPLLNARFTSLAVYSGKMVAGAFSNVRFCLNAMRSYHRGRE